MKRILLAGIGAMVFGFSAEAATISFIDEAAGNERGLANSGDFINYGDVTVTFSANETYHPYFDDLSGGKPAGLGVCKVLDGGDQCDPSNDDNLGIGESVTLELNKASNLYGFTFHDDEHDNLNSSLKTLTVAVNDGAAVEYSFQDLVAATLAGVNKVTFGYGGTDPNAYYLSILTADPVSEVPLPAAAPLLLSGLGLLGFQSVRRRRKAA